METQFARELITDLERIQRRSRARASTMWFPLVVFGMLSAASAGVVVAYGGDALGLYWGVSGPAGGVATAVYAVWRGRRVGVETRWGPYVALGVLILAGTCALGAGGALLGRPMVSAVGPSLVVSAGCVCFAYLERSALLGMLAVLLAVLAALLPIGGVDAELATATLAVVYGVTFIGAGLVLLTRGAHRDG